MEDASARDLFVRRTEQLLDLPLVTSGGLATSFKLHAKQGAPVEFSTTRPAEDPFRSFLMTFRLFVMSSEPTFVNSISNGLRRDLEGGRARDVLDSQRGQWKRACKTGSVQLIIDEGPIEPQELLDCWINGHYFHSDERKAKRLGELRQSGLPFTDQLMFDHVIAGTDYVRFLASLIIDARRDGLIA